MEEQQPCLPLGLYWGDELS